ncbi:MAG TPA: serine hydrolase domain-containing protein [Actinomycetes bacterium]|nr:serine hydrolase domain-containing protein [Actinomycetes bacterium]
MADLQSEIDDLAKRTAFSGVVRVDMDGEDWAQAWGFAHRGMKLPCLTDARFAMASGSKVFTALTIVSLIADGILALDTTARSVLGSDLPLIDDRVTLEQLLSHRSGIGDYLDEEVHSDTTEYVMPVPVQELERTEDFLKVLDGFPQKFEPGTDFVYCNGGFVVLALIAERASRTPYHDLVQEVVFDKANMTATGFLRSDEPTDAALGYLDRTGLRTNVLHLPVRGNGDGGCYTTLEDMHRFWVALVSAEIVPHEWVSNMTRPRSTDGSAGERFGLGIRLLPQADVMAIEGCDAGVSFRSDHDPVSGTGFIVLSNTSDGAWPLVKALEGGLFYPEAGHS